MSDLSNNPKKETQDNDVVVLPVPRQIATPPIFQSTDFTPSNLTEDDVNLRDYWRIVTARKWTIAIFFLVVVVTTVVTSFLTTPIFRASLTLQIERDVPKVLEYQDVVPVESAADKDFYQTQYELLESRTLAKRVIDYLGLAPFLTANLHSKGVFPDWLHNLSSSSSGRSEQDLLGVTRREAVEVFNDNLTIEPVKQSRLVKINFDSTDAEVASKVVNALANNFIQMNLERRVDASSYAKNFLEDKLASVKTKLEDSEKKLVEFARQNEIIKLDDDRTINLQNLKEIAQALTEAEQARIKAEALYNEVHSTAGHGFAAILGNDVVEQLKKTKADLGSTYVENLKIYKPNYPAMKQLQGQIETIQAEIDIEVGNVRASIHADLQIARVTEEKLAAKLGSLKKDVLDIQDSSIDYNILQREVDTNRELYEGLLQRMKEVGVAGGVTTNNISIVDAAEVPYKQHKPNIAFNALLAVIIGLLGGVALAFFFEHLDDTLKTAEDLERRMHLPVLGVVPEVKLQKTQVEESWQIAMLSYHDPRSGVAEAYRSVRTSLLFSTSQGAPKALLFTSPGPSEGKTTSALNVAITFTQTGSKVLLIDADLRNPSLHRLLNLENRTGLTNYLAGDAPPIDVSQYTDITNLFAIPSGPLPPNPAELLSGEKMLALLSLAVEKFDYVILDGPPVLGLADALVLANMVDGAVIVVEAGVTRQGQLQGTVKRLRSAHATIIGSVLAKYKEQGTGYGYYHYYYYYQNEDAVRQLKSSA